MSDHRVCTMVRTRDGTLPFQRYFVEQQCAPEVAGFAFEGAAAAVPHPAILEALSDRRLRAVRDLPVKSIHQHRPILALPGLRAALRRAAAPIIAVSPIIGGRAVKGPTAKMMQELWPFRGRADSRRSLRRLVERLYH